MKHLISRQKMANSHLISYNKIPGKTLLFAVYALSLEILKKKLKLNVPRAEGPRTEQKLQGSAKSEIDG